MGTNYHIGDVSPPSPKRQRISNSQQTTHNSKSNTPMTALATTELAEERGPITAASKPKRVRTGCLTCRERHLKCDEGYTSNNQQCQNCRKSSRLCKRGVRLNFIDTTVKSPPIIPPTADWKVKWVDFVLYDILFTGEAFRIVFALNALTRWGFESLLRDRDSIGGILRTHLGVAFFHGMGQNRTSIHNYET